VSFDTCTHIWATDPVRSKPPAGRSSSTYQLPVALTSFLLQSTHRSFNVETLQYKNIKFQVRAWLTLPSAFEAEEGSSEEGLPTGRLTA
jgi:hypothetical protein